MNMADERLKIAYISRMTFPGRAANCIQIMKMCEAMSKKGHEVCLIVTRNCRKRGFIENVDNFFTYYGVSENFKIVQIDWPDCKNSTRVWAWRAVRHAFKLAPDIVYARYVSEGLLAAKQGLPVVYEIHDIPGKEQPTLKGAKRVKHKIKSILDLRYTISYLIEEKVTEIRSDHYHLIMHRMLGEGKHLFRRLLANKNVIGLVIITEALKHDVLAFFPNISTKKIIVAPSGADAHFPVSPSESSRLETPDAFNVGYCGNLYKGKGMEIIAELAPLCPWAEFHVIGGLEEDIQYWKKYLKQQKNIHFYGYVESNRTARYVSEFSVCLLPNQKKVANLDPNINIGKYTSPMKLFEYMASGKPIIASNLPNLKEVLKHNDNAYLCSYNDPCEWAQALEKIHSSPDFGFRLGQQAQADIQQIYSWDARVEKIQRLFY